MVLVTGKMGRVARDDRVEDASVRSHGVETNTLRRCRCCWSRIVGSSRPRRGFPSARPSIASPSSPPSGILRRSADERPRRPIGVVYFAPLQLWGQPQTDRPSAHLCRAFVCYLFPRTFCSKRAVAAAPNKSGETASGGVLLS